MKIALSLAFVLLSGSALAQMAPALPVPPPPVQPSPQMAPRPIPPPQVKQAPRMAPPIAMTPPPTVPMGPEQNNEALAELLRAQTAAIRSLSNKLDSLEERIGKIEKGGHP